MKVLWLLLLFLCILAGGAWFISRNTLDGLGSIRSQEGVARAFVTKSMRAPLLRFCTDVGRFPTTAEGLTSLVIRPSEMVEAWKGPYLTAQLPMLDPWGQEYHYQSPGTNNCTSYDLWSLGPDGIESGDDLGNW